MKKTVKRLLALLCTTGICLSMAACGNSTTSGGQPGSDTSASSDYIKVVIAGASDPGNYLPFNADNSVRDTYSQYFYEPLFGIYGSEGLTPVIATGYERVSEGVYQVKIHDNVYDYNGEHITANDVVFCFNKVIENGERKSSMGELQTVNLIDDYTVEFIIQPDLIGTFERAVSCVYIVSQKSYEASTTGFSSDPVGTGPYYIDNWLPGASITFLKNENYWNKDGNLNNQNCDEIEVKFIAEPAQVAIELETGNVDFAYNVSSKDAESFVDMPGFSIIDTPFVQVRALGFNCDESSVFSDVRLRQAVCYAIDAAGIMQGVYDGKGGVATALAVPEPEGGFVLDYVQSWNDKIPYEYNLEKAKKLMAEAGYPNGGLKVRLMAKDMAEYRSTSEVMQSYLSKIGIEVEILCYENALYQTYRFQPDTFDFYLCGVANNNMPYAPAGWKWYLNRDAASGKNVLFMDDIKMQELLETALGIDTHNDQSVDALHSYILDTACLYPYAYTYNNYVHVDTILEPKVAAGIVFFPNMSTFSSDYARHG